MSSATGAGTRCGVRRRSRPGAATRISGARSPATQCPVARGSCARPASDASPRRRNAAERIARQHASRFDRRSRGLSLPVRGEVPLPYRGRMSVELVSRFTVDDGELNALHARAFGSDGSRVTPWRERLHRHALSWVGAFDAGQMVGFVQVCWDGGAHAFLLDTAVDPGRQHRGIGRRLVETAAADAEEAGCHWLHVDFEPDLEEFYLRRCGFTPTSAGLLRLDGRVGADS